jgi:hypothetical protein
MRSTLPFLEKPSTPPHPSLLRTSRPSTQPPPLLPPTTSPSAPPRTPRATYAQVVVAAGNTSSAPDTLPPLVESSLTSLRRLPGPWWTLLWATENQILGMTPLLNYWTTLFHLIRRFTPLSLFLPSQGKLSSPLGTSFNFKLKNYF